MVLDLAVDVTPKQGQIAHFKVGSRIWSDNNKIGASNENGDTMRREATAAVSSEKKT